MEIDMTIVISGQKATAHAVVSQLAATGKVGKPIVKFELDGKTFSPITADENGRVDLELGENLKLGLHTLTATVLGQNPAVRVEEEFRVSVATPEPTGPFGRFMMILFWITVLFFGPKLLTLTFLLFVMAYLGLVAKVRRVSFWSMLGNNNWVFKVCLSMAVISGIIGYFNPMLPEPLGSHLLDSARKLFGLAEKATRKNSVFWGILNHLYFGEYWTFGWRNVALVTYGIATIPAFFVSFWDETLEFVAKLLAHLGKGEGFVSFAFKDALMELIYKAFKRG